MGFIENLDWRYATKEFDGRKLPADILEKILISIRLSPSSFGLQPYHVTVIGNDQLKKELNSRAFWDQKQIITCSHLFVFSTDSNIGKRAKDYVSLASEAGRTDITDDPEFDYEKGAIEFSDKMGAEWATKQTYIALGFALAACAELKVDSCPMEAADFTSIKKILCLSDNLEPKVLLAIGHRSHKDGHAQLPKLRFKERDIFDFKK